MVIVGNGLPLTPSFFFLHAGYRIRYIGVTEVQTCALPISSSSLPIRAAVGTLNPTAASAPNSPAPIIRLSQPGIAPERMYGIRSEERRVGKKCRFRLSLISKEKKSKNVYPRLYSNRETQW